MYTRLNNTITNAIKDVMSNSVCDFDNWWKDDFETEIYFETAEDFKNLSDTDLEIAKYDWISWCLDGFVSEVCNLLGIKMYNTHSKYNEIILFQSTPPQRRRRLEFGEILCKGNFNPRLHKGGDA